MAAQPAIVNTRKIGSEKYHALLILAVKKK